MPADFTPRPRDPEEIVAEKLTQFAKQSRGTCHCDGGISTSRYPRTSPASSPPRRMGTGRKPPTSSTPLKQQRVFNDRPPGLEKLWPAIGKIYGVAEQTHAWPANNSSTTATRYPRLPPPRHDLRRQRDTGPVHPHRCSAKPAAANPTSCSLKRARRRQLSRLRQIPIRRQTERPHRRRQPEQFQGLH